MPVSKTSPKSDQLYEVLTKEKIPPEKIEEVIQYLEMVKDTGVGLILDHRFIERVKE